ncbi:zf-UBP-domain-containing protein [Obba rivulosa]|uniref:Zf-UBP-domain-containing protein n=1 Tax=Obba rivulosa TaxID=1052685 RepID=A0A8E2DRC2_9APHY|nr:zf-UBP-domain-containing protein [Obba rivulosa]
MRGYHLRIYLQPASTTNPTSASYTQSSTLARQQNVFVPSSLFQPLPVHSPRSTTRRNTVSFHSRTPSASSSSQRAQDYRLGPIRIDWVDFIENMSVGASKKAGSGKGREKREPVMATFVPQSAPSSKSGSTNLPVGVVHIYREAPSGAEAEPLSSSPPPPGESSTPLASETVTNGQSSTEPELDTDSVTLGVLAVPSWMTPADFLAFVAPAADGIAHLRMIRDSAPNRSIVVLRFRNPAEATEFAEAYNGKQFNSMEPETCHVVRIHSITIDSEDPISPAVALVSTGQSQGSTAMYELPTCPVCLERMDSAVTGLVTVPCSHTFHCACLSKWGDSRCPVCRYSQTLMSSHPSSSHTTRSTHPIPFSANSASPSQCADCGSTTNLWICLVCGNIGCGRYGRAHAHAHYTQTTHLYALELETQRVWDYAGDGYVHRLIQNKADGKLVELPSAASAVTRGEGGGGAGPSAADALSAEKIEAIGIEYSYLLMSQLDSQRAFYEEQTADLRNQVGQMRGLVEKLSMEVDGARNKLHDYETKQRAHEEARTAELEKEKLKVEKRAERATELARNLAKELQEERAVSEGLMKNLAKTKEITEQTSRDKEKILRKVRELEDQLRDVMFFLEARDKIEGGQGDIAEAAGGSIELAATPQQAKRNSKKK